VSVPKQSTVLRVLQDPLLLDNEISWCRAWSSCNMSGRYMLQMLPTVFPSFCIFLWPFQEFNRRACHFSADFVLVPSSSGLWIRRVCHPSKRLQLLVSASRQGINIQEDLDFQQHRYDNSNQSFFSFGTRRIFAGVLLKNDGVTVVMCFLFVFWYLCPHV